MKKGIILALTAITACAILLTGCNSNKVNAPKQTTTTQIDKSESDEAVNSYTLENWQNATDEERNVVTNMFNAMMVDLAPDKTVHLYTRTEVGQLLETNPTLTLGQIAQQEIVKY